MMIKTLMLISLSITLHSGEYADMIIKNAMKHGKTCISYGKVDDHVYIKCEG